MKTTGIPTATMSGFGVEIDAAKAKLGKSSLAGRLIGDPRLAVESTSRSVDDEHSTDPFFTTLLWTAAARSGA